MPLDRDDVLARRRAGCSTRASRRSPSQLPLEPRQPGPRGRAAGAARRALPGPLRQLRLAARAADRRVPAHRDRGPQLLHRPADARLRDHACSSELRGNGYDDRLLFAQCDGGLIDAEDVIARPVMTLESGPVGGVVACAKAGAERGQAEHHRRRHGRHDVRRQRDLRRRGCRSATASSSSSTTSSCAWSTSSRSAPAAAASPGSTRSRARCGSARRAPAPSPARSVTAAAARCRRSPTPTSCSAC